MSAYKSLSDIIAERHTALLAEERPTDTTTCCARCRRGSRALGTFPCAYDGVCPCHGRNPR